MWGVMVVRHGHGPPGLTDQQLSKQPLADSGKNLTGWMTKEAWLTLWGGGTLMKVTDGISGLGLVGTCAGGSGERVLGSGEVSLKARRKEWRSAGCDFGERA